MIRFKFSRRIGSGGMGDVFLALQEGIGGFEKMVVVKRIHPELTADQSFVDMFLNEARLVAKIRHPNVVEILDIQRDAHGLFIVLEYISGETIHYIMQRLAESGQAVPYPIACRLVAGLAEGLHAAHETTDNNGDLLGIVHRDVTPSNLIVGYNGIPKILDFGVAAGAAQRSVDDGAAVGKVGYQAPEQIAGLEEDERSDVFQLAICLHEMLSGKPLFATDDEHEAMLNVVERPIPKPGDIRDGVPAELDDLVMRALTLDWEQRTKTADDLGRELEALLEANSEHVGQKRVAEWMREQFADRYDERVQLERDLVSELRSEVRTDVDPAELPAMFDEVPTAGRRASPEAQTRVAVPRRMASRGKREVARKRNRWLVIGGVVAAAGVVGGYVIRSGQKQAAPPVAATVPVPAALAADALPAVAPPSAAVTDPAHKAAAPAAIKVTLQVVPASASIVLDGVLVGKGQYRGMLARDGNVHNVELSAPVYKTRTLRFKDTAPPSQVALEVDPSTRVSVAEPEDGARTDKGPRSPSVRRKQAKQTKPRSNHGATTVASKEGDGETKTAPKPPNTTKQTTDKPAKKADPWQNRKQTDNKNPWK